MIRALGPHELTPPPEKAEEKALPLRPGKQLFANPALIDRSSSLFLRVNRPRKSGVELLRPERYWEGQCLCFGTVLEEGGRRRLYYRGWSQEEATGGPYHLDCREFKRSHGYSRGPLCIAEVDGSAAERIPFAGSPVPESNVIWDEETLDDFNLFRDDRAEDPAERYKMLASQGNILAGLSAAVSADGLHWRWKRTNAVSYFGDRCSFWYNPLNRRYVAWSRHLQIYMHKRWIFQQETEIFPEWRTREADPELFHRYDENLATTPHLVLATDARDPETLQFYSGYPFFWGNMFIAYLECYHIDRQTLDVQLAGSCDGTTWFRLGDRAPFMECGGHGDFDAYWIVPTYNPPLLRDGTMSIYYNGRPDPHRYTGFRHVAPGMRGSFGLATLREDGFLSYDATGETGRLATRLLEPESPARDLAVNCEPFRPDNPAMPMRLEIRVADEAGRRIAGWEIVEERARTIWHRLPAFDFPRRFTLEFAAQNCRLYSFKLGEDRS